VLLAALVWARNKPSKPALVIMGWIAFALVQLQGLLGGLRVVLSQNEIGIFHGALAQLFFVLLCVMAMLTGPRWAAARQWQQEKLRPMHAIALLTVTLIFIQLVLGATMRHQHAGLAIPDFPLAYGRLWPATDPDAILRYNQQRVETSAVDPITADHVILQMMHRIVAVGIFAGVALFVWSSIRRLGSTHPVARLGWIWLGMILLQVVLGAATIWSRKAADIATAHVLIGALSLAMGTWLCILCARSPEKNAARALSDAPARETALIQGDPATQA
jgi:cytochrome c oxidase assembly protein subunit 15